jgi:membrane protein DedA with SNARE-associated domain
MVQVLHHYGYSFLFLVVFVECVGLPLPGFTVILIAAALAAELHFRLPAIFALAVVAALAGDSIWYALGRLRGRPILRKLCSLSLSPDSCVSRTESLFQRHGLKSLLVAKFMPGLNTVAAPLAGMLKVPRARFIGADVAGIALWAGSAMALGLGFRTQVERVIAWWAAFGRAGALVLGMLLAGLLLLKWEQRRRFYRRLERARISAADLKQRLDQGERLSVVDLRHDLSFRVDGVKIAGAIWIRPEDFHQRYQEIPREYPVVMYCT